jgi:DNA-binding SARP family transcriptional activator/streptogramin lyase
VHDLKELGKRGLSPRHEDAIEFRILGPLEASRLGQPLEVGAGKQRALLALLLLRAGEVVSTDRLIDALWGEHPPPSALNSIHVYVSQLRKVLGNGRLETRGRGYLLALEPAQLDLARFEHLLRDGRELLTSGEPDRAANTLRGALGLWRGSPLSDVASVPFAEGEVARLEELRLVALEERIEADLALGRHAELVPELEGLIRDHPLRERLRAQLMLALYRSGRQSEALAAYQQARKMLSTELGLEPGRTLRELEAGILRHDPTLDPPAQTPGLPRSARRKWPAVIAIAAALLLAAALAGFKLTGGDTPSPEVLPNSLVRIDPRTMKVADVVPIGDAPDLVVVAGGFVWVTHYVLRDTPDGGLRNAGDRTLTRVDPSTGEAKPVGGLAPCGLAADPSGDVWVANCFVGGGTNVVRVEATTLRFRTYPVPGDEGFYRGLAYGGGSLWLSDVFGRSTDGRTHHTVTHFDPETGVAQSIPLARETDSSLAWSGGYGDLWMSNFGDRSVSRFHADSKAVETIDGVGTNPGNLVVGGDIVWVADWGAPQVVRLRAVGPPRRRSVRLPVKNPSAVGVWNVAAGAGAVWATAPRDRTLWRIDPTTNHATSIPMRYWPTGVAADSDAVWVTVRADKPLLPS